MARKHQRAHRGPELWTQKEEEKEEDDHLLHMNPSLMTERQQMTFLLRTTAREGLKVVNLNDTSSEDKAVTSPRQVNEPKRIQHEQQKATTTLIHRNRGRPIKNKKKKKLNVADMKRRVVTTQKRHKARSDKKVAMRPSFSTLQLDGVQSLGHRAPQCALCCDYDTAHEASFSDVLFLCPTCDRKYPTQQALGRRTCMI
ncbi:unnamed protein product [Peronospora farinosa]|uniref:Uncharacterized protein n=1 Tax=Peronospora farinosa TaxID=134698 RepID=A0AAV0UMI2_9STRA|nr:unnamed protein product [Peronospora farinosa]CAI5736714.1 unnamed protein product [Peronospora farinosa]